MTPRQKRGNNMNATNLKAQLKAAKATLIANGWTFSCSVMNGAGKSEGPDSYGSMYFKGENKFALNVETMNNLPK